GLGNLVANLARGAGDCLRGLLALLANLILVQEATSRLAGVLTRQNDPNSHCRNAQCRACYQRNELASLHSSTSPVQFDSAHQSRDDVANLRSGICRAPGMPGMYTRSCSTYAVCVPSHSGCHPPNLDNI